MIRLPEDDPAAFDVLLQYVYFGTEAIRPLIHKAPTEDHSVADHKAGWFLRKVYILSEKFGCEQLQNFLMDAFVRWWRK